MTRTLKDIETDISWTIKQLQDLDDAIAADATNTYLPTVLAEQEALLEVYTTEYNNERKRKREERNKAKRTPPAAVPVAS